MGEPEPYREWRGPRTGATLWRVATPGATRVLPDAAIDLLWSTGEHRFLLAGPDTKPWTAVLSENEAVWGLRLRPGLAHGLLRIPVREVADGRVELGDAVPRTSGRPGQRAISSSGRLAELAETDPGQALEQLLLELAAGSRPDRERLRRAAAVNHAALVGRSLREMADEQALSERSLRRFADEVFGYGPKTLALIHRFRRARALIQAGSALADAAAFAGYADQAHLTRDVRRFAGVGASALRSPV